MSLVDYRAKYIKYKSKYFKLKNSLQMVGGSDKTRLIFFKLEGCPPCNALLPIWEEVSKTEMNKHIDFVIMETFRDDSKNTKQEIKDLKDKYKIESYPTVILEKGDGIRFSGDRTVEGIKAFINKHINN